MSTMSKMLRVFVACVLTVGLCPAFPAAASAQEGQAGIQQSRGLRATSLSGVDLGAQEEDDDYNIAKAHAAQNYSAYSTGQQVNPINRVVLNGRTLKKGTDYTVSFKNQETGEIVNHPNNPVNPGIYTATISGIRPYFGTLISEFSLFDSHDLLYADCDIASSFVYSGTPLKPSPFVTMNNVPLKQDVDYTVSYRLANSETEVTSITEPGYYRAVIRYVPGSNYQGKNGGPFFNVYDQHDMLACSIGCPSNTFFYTGDVIDPGIWVKDCNGAKLRENTDYTITYKPSNADEQAAFKDVGSYIVTVNGIGDWTGKKYLQLRIKDGKDISNATAALASMLPYQEGATDIECELVLDGVVLKKGVDYDVSFIPSGATEPVGSIASPGRYQVKFTGMGSYRGSLTWSVLFEEKNSIAWATIDSPEVYAYTGEVIKPSMTLTLDGKTLVENRDYTLRCIPNYNSDPDTEAIEPIRQGAYYLVATGIGDYTGTIKAQFSVVDSHSLDHVQISGLEEAYPWSGRPIKPNPVVKDLSGRTLEQGVDYRTTWAPVFSEDVASPDETCTAVGTYHVGITGIGDYFGEAWYTYAIEQPDGQQNATISGLQNSYQFTGSSIPLDYGVTLSDSEQLVEGEDYAATLYYWTSETSIVELNSARDVILPGSYQLKVSPIDKRFKNYPTFDFEVAEVGETALWERLSGKNRYLTMQAIVQEGFQDSPVAIVATGEAFPDALAASALAGAYDAPVILTKKNALSSQAADELDRLNVQRVFLMGGEAALSANVEQALRDKGIAVDRVMGNTRIKTSVETYKRVKASGAYSGTVVLTTSENYADALSIGPWSYVSKSPILLVKGNKLDAGVAEAVSEANHVVILGGTSAVSAAIEKQVRSLNSSVERLSGRTRYATSQVIANWELGKGMTCSMPAIATGKNFPDALAGAALCGKNGSVLLLADSVDDPTVSFVAGHKGEIEHGYFLGGEGALPVDLAEAIIHAAGGVSAIDQARADLAAAQSAKDAADAALASATAQEAASAQALADATSAKTSAEEALATARADKDAADAALTNAQSAYDTAQAAYDAAAGDKAAKESAYDNAVSNQTDAQAALDATTAALESANAALEAAKVPTPDPAAIAAAQSALAQANANLEAAAAIVAKGSVGFFESRNEQAAIEALTNCAYASYTELGQTGDATSLDNMKLALDIIDMCNVLRGAHGLDPLYVSDYMMAVAQANANYSGVEGWHARQFEDISENIARNNDDDPQHGAVVAFTQWYYLEKQNYDKAVAAVPNGGDYTFTYKNTSYTVTLPNGWTNWTAYEFLVNAPDFYNTIGHYLNIINPDYTATGAAYCEGTGWKNAYAQDFQLTIVGNSIDSERIDFATYKTIVMNYYNKVMGDLATAQQAVADAQAALEAAQNNTTVNPEAVAAAEAAVAEAEGNQIAAQAAYENAVSVANAAQSDLSTAVQVLTNATRQLASAQDNLDAKTTDAANKNAFFVAAQDSLTSATNAYNAAKATHDADAHAKAAAEADQAEKAAALEAARAALNALLSAGGGN